MTTGTTRVALAGRAPELLPLLARLRTLADAHALALVAVATPDQRDQTLRAELASRHGAAEVRLRPEEILTAVGIDAFIVASPLAQRHAHVGAALASGCHVLASAPIGMTVRAAARCVAAAEENNRLLAVTNSDRFALEAQMLRWAVGSGIVGELKYVLDFAFGADGISPNICIAGDPALHDRLRGGGALLARAVHDCALLRFACGDIVEVAGHDARLEPERIVRAPDGRVLQRFAASADDTLGAQFRFACGAIGQYVRSWAGRGTILPARRTLWAARGAVDGETIHQDGAAPRNLQEAWKTHVSPIEVERLFPRGVVDPLALELASFFNALARWERGPQTAVPHHGREALRDLACAWAIAESGRCGRRLAVQDVESLAVEEAQRDLNAHLKIV
jgi:1,5-anhydro-D-fructose reductase (1,5-anhydro-D-mannitol-forming)